MHPERDSLPIQKSDVNLHDTEVFRNTSSTASVTESVHARQQSAPMKPRAGDTDPKPPLFSCPRSPRSSAAKSAATGSLPVKSNSLLTSKSLESCLQAPVCLGGVADTWPKVGVLAAGVPRLANATLAGVVPLDRSSWTLKFRLAVSSCDIFVDCSSYLQAMEP